MYILQKPCRGFKTDIIDGDKQYYIFCDMKKESPTFGRVFIVYKEYVNSDTPAEFTIATDKSRFKII